MKRKWFLPAMAILIIAVASPVFAQVATRAGSIYGKVVDEQGAPLPRVSVTLESNLIQPQTATSGPTGCTERRPPE